MVNVSDMLILFGINSLIDLIREPIKSIEELRDPDHLLYIICEHATQIGAQSWFQLAQPYDSIHDKFQCLSEYLFGYFLDEQSRFLIMQLNLNEMAHGNKVHLSKLALLVLLAARDNIPDSSDLSVRNAILYRRLTALLNLRSFQITRDDSPQLNVDDWLEDIYDSGGTQSPQTTSVKREHRGAQICSRCLNDLLNNNNHSSILDRSFTGPPGQSGIAAAAPATQQPSAFLEDLFKVKHEFLNLQHKYSELENSYKELMGKNRELSAGVLRQAAYDIIEDERNRLRLAVFLYETENKRLQEVDEKIVYTVKKKVYLQTHLQQYQKKNDEMDEKIVKLEKELRASEQQCDECSKKMANQNADIILRSNISEKLEDQDR